MFNRKFISRTKTPIALGFSLMLLMGCVIKINADDRPNRNISKVFGSIKINSDTRAGDLESVNGGIRIGDNSLAKEVSTVNGSIRVGSNVEVDSLETVNGGISAGDDLTVRDGVETVNGRITLNQGASIGDDVSTVNGNIIIEDGNILDDVNTVSGDIEVLGESHIGGDVIFEENSNFYHGKNDRPTLTVAASAVIEGSIILYQPVQLNIADGAEVGDIIERF